MTELGSNSQLHAIKLDEHAVAQLFVKPVEGYHQVKRCSVNEFILGGAVALGETAHRVPVSGQAVVVHTKNEDRPWTPTEAGSGTGHVDYKATWLMTPKQEHEARSHRYVHTPVCSLTRPDSPALGGVAVLRSRRKEA